MWLKRLVLAVSHVWLGELLLLLLLLMLGIPSVVRSTNVLVLARRWLMIRVLVVRLVEPPWLAAKALGCLKVPSNVWLTWRTMKLSALLTLNVKLASTAKVTKKV
jgi:hypothetical protein